MMNERIRKHLDDIANSLTTLSLSARVVQDSDPALAHSLAVAGSRGIAAYWALAKLLDEQESSDERLKFSDLG